MRGRVIEVVYMLDKEFRIVGLDNTGCGQAVDSLNGTVIFDMFGEQQEAHHLKEQYRVALEKKGPHSFAGFYTLSQTTIFYMCRLTYCGVGDILFGSRVFNMPGAVGLWSPRRRQVLYGIGLALGEKQIASKLSTSIANVRYHKKMMAEDLDCDRNELGYFGSIFVSAMGEDPAEFVCPPTLENLDTTTFDSIQI